MDTLTKEQRSRNMARISSKNTKPEILVRRLLHALGYRYRLHNKQLPGKPDIVFTGRKKVIFVHGCFWHRHSGCKFSYTPKSRPNFWQKKFKSNVRRDEQVHDLLQEQGWNAIVIWECETKKTEQLSNRLRNFLDN